MTKFAVPEMNCVRSSSLIKDALCELDPDLLVEADLNERILKVETTMSPADVLSVLCQVGFAANVAHTPQP